MTQDVFNVQGIAPKALNVKAIRDALTTALLAEGDKQRKMLNKTVEDWKGNKPTFEPLLEVDGDGVTLVVGPTGPIKTVEIWNYLNEGTRGHMVYPKSKKALRFRPSSGGNYVFSKGHFVHGILPRNWTDIIYRERKRPFANRMDNAIKVGLERAERGLS